MVSNVWQPNFGRGFISTLIRSIDISNNKEQRSQDSAASSPRATRGKSDEEEELRRFARDIKNRPAHELERDLVEVSYDIEFLEAQVKLGLRDYSTSNLQEAKSKIAILKRKVELMKLEYERRK